MFDHLRIYVFVFAIALAAVAACSRASVAYIPAPALEGRAVLPLLPSFVSCGCQ